jgi:hypothetical protein
MILIIAAVIVGLVVLMRLIQPKLSPPEEYLFYEIQRKSPQMDNLRLVMWIKMVVHLINTESDLDYQKPYFEDPQKTKQVIDLMSGFGGAILFPLFGFEALSWNLDVFKEDPLFLRIAAIIVIRSYPKTADVVEDLIAHSPDLATIKFIEKHEKKLSGAQNYRARYAFNLYKTLTVLTTTSRNEWWQGTNPDIREWAEYALSRLPKAYADIDFSAFNKNRIDGTKQSE